MNGKSHSKSVTTTLTHQNQNLDSLHRVVAEILRMSGCGRCGLVSVLHVQFGGDPPPELGKEGVVGFEQTGL